MQQEITWIECDGGPHILIECKYLKLWKTAKQEDYEETAQIKEYILDESSFRLFLFKKQ